MPSRSFLCLRLALVLLVPIAVFAANGTVVVLCVMALGVPSIGAVKAVLRRWCQSYFGPALIGLVIYMCISACYAIVPADSADKALRLFGLLLVSIMAVSVAEGLTPDEQSRIARDWALCAAAIILLAGLELATDGIILRHVKDYSLEHLTRGREYTEGEYVTWRVHNALGRAAIVLLAIGPFSWLEIRHSRPLALLAIVCGLALVLILPIRTAQIAAFAALALGIATYLAPRTAIVAAASAALLGILVFPWAALMIDPHRPLGFNAETLSLSLQHRLYIWHFAAERITDHPWFGWGLESSRAIPGANQEVTLYLNGQPYMKHPVTLDLHPHNAVLHVWLEGGVFGALLFAGVVLGIAQKIYRLTGQRALQAATMAAVAGLAIPAGASFGLWQDWWLSTMVFAGLFSIISERAHRDRVAP